MYFAYLYVVEQSVMCTCQELENVSKNSITVTVHTNHDHIDQK